MLQVYISGVNTGMNRAILCFHDANTKITLNKIGIIRKLVRKSSDVIHAVSSLFCVNHIDKPWFGLHTVVHV
ncbi:hypothetical protein EUGRSUZ_I01672 [Eucalyptus grandis]|uniref:Uncharacterized protein n=2 Tax=Eucalyptus grandis TaxID=71139 RepID=A0ACC3JH69_EUCGR|nr:hypothetical protein EUGRSUZ_I01672 [Eucalyptus grandis]